MTNDEIDTRWVRAMRDDVRGWLLTMSDDEFVAHVSFRVGVMTSEHVRALFMTAVHDEVWNPRVGDDLMRTVRNPLGVRNMMMNEYGFVRSY